MTQSIDFYFDFASPHSYLAHLRIEEVAQKCDIQFNYIPVLLGGIFKATNNRSPMEAFAGIDSKEAYQKVEIHRYLKRHGLLDKFKMNPYFPVNTLALMRAAVAAQQIDDETYRTFINTVFDGMWLQQLDLNNVDVIQSLLAGTGLPLEKLLTNMQTTEVKQALISNTEKAVSKGLFGVPSFISNDELYFGKESLYVFELGMR